MGVIRGAICAENTVEDISCKSVELIKVIVYDNAISLDKIEAIIFSVTEDLNACYPAKSVREQFRLDNVAFMCVQEMRVPNSLPHCIRVSVFVKGLAQKKCFHCYIGQAKVLRPDLK
ncbi:MAG: chorismate mutase [Clostridiales bacterium]|nr:chorismate mutase [Clostridiales bacterium]